LTNFTLESAFCRTKSSHGGSWIYMKKIIMKKELNYVQELGDENI